MALDIFVKALNLTMTLEARAWQSGALPLILLSGGECTEHPKIVEMIELVTHVGAIPMVITNGMWLENEELKKQILSFERIFIQVTNDARFYPKKPPIVEDKRISYVDSLIQLLPLGRASRKKGLMDLGLPLKKAPSSFNLRSMTRHFGDVREALVVLRTQMKGSGLGQQCAPNINEKGELLAGESRFCHKVGDVDSTPEDITKAIIEMRCNNCGLVDNLSQEQKRAIGESVLFTGTE